jgi:hypothetical protein
MPLPYKEPSQVLYSLLNTIVEEGRRFASAADLQISDMSANSPVGSTLAILERTLKIMSAVQSRIHHSMKQELKLLKEIIRDYTPEEYSYDPVEGSPKAKQSDYDLVTVIPVSDPNAATMAQKIVQYQAVLQLAQGAPQIYNMPQLHRQMLEVLGIRNAQKLIPLEDDQKPKDPITENMDILRQRPVKAFMYQDQDAHITAHSNFLQDPTTAAVIGQNPQAQAMTAAIQAHIAEHFGFKYRQMIEQQLGAPLPYIKDEEDDSIPEDYEIQISRLVAQASTQLLQQNQAQAAQQQAQQQAQDPIIQMQMQELQIKAQEQERKAQRDQADIALESRRLDIEEQRTTGQLEIEGTRLGAQISKDKDTLERKSEFDGTKLGVEMAHKKQQVDVQKGQITAQLIAAGMNSNNNAKKENNKK